MKKRKKTEIELKPMKTELEDIDTELMPMLTKLPSMVKVRCKYGKKKSGRRVYTE